MPTNKGDYMKEYRKAKAEGQVTPLCACGKQLRGKLSKLRGVCSECWKLTDAGKAETKAAVKRHRKG